MQLVPPTSSDVGPKALARNEVLSALAGARFVHELSNEAGGTA
jgi:hypothetical protein